MTHAQLSVARDTVGRQRVLQRPRRPSPLRPGLDVAHPTQIESTVETDPDGSLRPLQSSRRSDRTGVLRDTDMSCVTRRRTSYTPGSGRGPRGQTHRSQGGFLLSPGPRSRRPRWRPTRPSTRKPPHRHVLGRTTAPRRDPRPSVSPHSPTGSLRGSSGCVLRGRRTGRCCSRSCWTRAYTRSGCCRRSLKPSRGSSNTYHTGPFGPRNTGHPDPGLECHGNS